MNDKERTDRRVDELENRIDKLEKIINKELGYDIGTWPVEPQTVDCVCGETFDVNVINGLTCPECDRGESDRNE